MLAGYKRNVEIQSFIEKLKPKDELRGLKDFLIMPVQRIPRLKLMLEELLKYVALIVYFLHLLDEYI